MNTTTTTLKALITRHRVRISNEWADSNPHMMTAGDWPATHWRSTLKIGRRQLTVPFSQGMAHSGEPDAYSVLSCLLSDASGSEQPFEDWARDLGYDSDSRKAERTYRVVVKQTEKLREFLGESFEQFLYAEQ